MTQGTGRWAGAGASAVVVALLVAAWLMMAAPQLLARGADERAGQPDERAGQPDERAGQPDERAGQSDERAGQSDERAGQPGQPDEERADAAGADPPDASGASPALLGSLGEPLPPPPALTVGADAPLAAPVAQAARELVDLAPQLREPPGEALATVAGSGDVRLLWLLYDLVRFVNLGGYAAIQVAIGELSGIADVPSRAPSVRILGDWLIAWDLPAPPGYRELKRDLYLLIEPRWEPLFADPEDAVDWRVVGWGGVFIDDRPVADDPRDCPRGCIPALDDPPVTDAAGGSWYADDRLVFGVTIGGAARAYPKHMMEVHEMVNDAVGGRRIAMPYCTLCGSAQVYLTDDVRGFQPVLRTSGLLARSNKLTYDVSTWSAIDTFTGEALSGPLRRAGVTLTQVSVITSTWGEWKEAYPHTAILARDGGLGWVYPDDPLGGRDDGGPIFPVGDVDPRLGVHHRVVGVVAPDGRAVAFAAGAARLALAAGEPVVAAGVELRADAGGLRAFAASGRGEGGEGDGGADLVTHESFWFAWSQFHAGTVLWPSNGAR